jgi:lipoate-protein ligase A
MIPWGRGDLVVPGTNKVAPSWIGAAGRSARKSVRKQAGTGKPEGLEDSQAFFFILYPASRIMYHSATMNTWRFLDTGPNTGAFNMALDEKLLAQAAAGEAVPVLRLYTWDPPALSLGRFQKIETDVNKDTSRKLGIDIVRRVTGGRAVLHNHELTYSVVARTDDPLFPGNVLGAYKVIAAGLLAGLGNLGIHAEMVSRSGRHAHLVKKNSKDPACFSSPSWYEILVNGKKIIGSAQRRVPGAFLQHGSILMAYDPVLEASVISGSSADHAVTSIQEALGKAVPLEDVKQAFLKGFSTALGVIFSKKEVLQPF